MGNLILSDFRLNKLHLGLNYVFPSFYMPFLYLYFAKGHGYAGMSALFGFIILLVPFLRENRFNGTVLTCSLPFNRRTIVLARYVSSWLLLLGSLLYFFLLACVMRLFFPATTLHFERVLSLKSYAVSILVVAILISFLFPIIFRFGLSKETMMWAIAIPNLLLASLLFLGFLGRSKGTFEYIVKSVIVSAEKAYRLTVAGSTYLLEHFGVAGFLLLFVLLLALLNFVSLKCSEKLFAYRDV